MFSASNSALPHANRGGGAFPMIFRTVGTLQDDLLQFPLTFLYAVSIAFSLMQLAHNSDRWKTQT